MTSSTPDEMPSPLTRECGHKRIDVQRMREGERQVACHDCGHVFVVIPDGS